MDDLQRLLRGLPHDALITISFHAGSIRPLSRPGSDTHFLTVSDAAAQLRVAENTVRNWIRAGRIEATKLGGRYRIPSEALRSASGGTPTAEGAALPPQAALPWDAWKCAAHARLDGPEAL
jgi:excisionase family DNA binding protein